MKMFAKALVVLALTMPALALAGTWEKVSLIDHMCVAKMGKTPDKHPTSCLLKCAASGYGILTSNGKWLALDKAGNEKALEALKATKKKDHIRVNVTGEQTGETIAVSSLALAD